MSDILPSSPTTLNCWIRPAAKSSAMNRCNLAYELSSTGSENRWGLIFRVVGAHAHQGIDNRTVLGSSDVPTATGKVVRVPRVGDRSTIMNAWRDCPSTRTREVKLHRNRLENRPNATGHYRRPWSMSCVALNFTNYATPMPRLSTKPSRIEHSQNQPRRS
jgi:hypothetical protein